MKVNNSEIMKNKVFWLFLLFIFSVFNAASAQNEGQLYSKAVREARSGNRDAAFMYFRALLADHPDSKYTEKALFATGEYYFSVNDNSDAFRAFTRYIDDYPDSQATAFALMYLLKIAEQQRQESFSKDIEMMIVTLKRLSFLFRESKEYRYQSPLCRKYRAVYYIDKVEFFIDGEFFAKISY